MKLVNVTNKEQLKELTMAWAMTWEGLVESSFEEAMEDCCKDGVDGTGYLIKGRDMNRICGLTGSNAYPDDLNIFAIKNFKGLAMNYGARWLWDIVANNGDREGYLPFDLD